MTPAIRYPAGRIVPHGAYHVLKGDHPMVALRSFDDSIVFHLMGGQSIPDYTAPESVQIKRDGLKGLIAPWTTIDQKGATQDGVTFVDALGDPLEVTIDAVARGRDARHLRKVVRDLTGSLHRKKTCELSWTTHEMGRWWADLRWYKTILNPFSGAQNRRQELTLILRADNNCWRSYDDVDSFSFAYEDMTDTFNFTDADDLGVNWPQYYTGDGDGFCHANGSQAEWVDDPDTPFFTEGREVVNGPFKDFATDTDNQVVSIVLGSIPEFSFPDGAYNDLWGRMGRNLDGTWNGYGIRARLGWGVCELTQFNNFVPTVMRSQFMLIPPLFGEKFTLVCGEEGDPRLFKIQRNGSDMLICRENGAGSALGAAYRGVGFGMHAGGSLVTQATPASVRKISAGDNATVSQTGYLRRVNAGDQDMWDRYTLYGPGVFRIADGPGNPGTSVEFGPLLRNQVMQIRTQPGRRGVVDLTSAPPAQQELTLFQQALKDFISFATGNNVPPLLVQIESNFGILPPQGNPYSLMHGRFSRPLAPKSPGKPADVQHVWCQIDDGNASSRIVAAGTPLRIYPD